MVKNLQDYLKTGRDPAYLKNGDTITEELARELICAGDEDGCLDGEFEITQSRIVEDIIGGEGVYETIWRESPDHPWTYVGLCKAGMDKNLAPIHAKMTYVCSKYRAKNEVEMQQHIMDAMEACRTVHERGDIPVAPHLYWPRFLDEGNPEDRPWMHGNIRKRKAGCPFFIGSGSREHRHHHESGCNVQLRMAAREAIHPRTRQRHRSGH